MKNFLILIFVLLIFTGEIIGQTQNGIVRTGFVIQIWSIENINKPISENTFPIEVIYPIRENINLQLSHSPAVSHSGQNTLSGLSDTWLRSSYSFLNKRALVSLGLGLPTGKTKLDSTELILSTYLSQNAFKFRLPVFGQGLTISLGAMYAHPISEKATLGLGVNYVYRGKYKYSKLQTDTYDPGEQIGANLGFDYLVLPNLRSNIDLVFNYYTSDKLGNIKNFVSGPKISSKIGLQYQFTLGYAWIKAYYSAKGKNETWDGQTVVPDSINNNIILRELEAGTKLGISEILFIFVNGEIRSYVENENKEGWVDIYGVGLGCELKISDKFAITMETKLFYGDGEFATEVRNFSGFELQIGSQWKF